MISKLSYKKKLFFYFFIVFVAFIVVVTLFQYRREKEYRIKQLESKLNTYTELINSYIIQNNIYEENKFYLLDSLTRFIPDRNIRITIIKYEGKVLYDSYVSDYVNMENHINRPEVQMAMHSKYGHKIRRSATTKKDYYYYARFFNKYFVRTAIVYNIIVKDFLKAESLFLFFIIILFFIIWASLAYVSDRLGKSISQLKDFSIKASRNEIIDEGFSFPKNELGVISEQIIQIYSDLKNTKDELTVEKERLIRHLNVLQEGIAVFSPQKKKLLANNHFIQYINIISDKPVILPEHIFEINEFKDINYFIDKQIINNQLESENIPESMEKTINIDNKSFAIKCIVFNDKSFEIMISDISKLEKRKRIKQEMTNNIAHELKTPVSSIMGYLETLLSSNIEPSKKDYFIERAHQQAGRLSNLINDISLLTKIEEAGNLYDIELLKIREIVENVIDDVQLALDEKKINVHLTIDKKTIVRGNQILIYSIFRNLIDNTIYYAGTNLVVHIDTFFEDDDYYYFLYSDNGIGIPEEYLPRIFERFYRIDKGRSRKQGGTGLGLSIVKNAVIFHKGEISVKSKPGRGVEFIFSISKKL
jgi:two-component system OmpR family sensor kinase/two-component system phosphate regulon sensor histidine kinase PhoR